MKPDLTQYTVPYPTHIYTRKFYFTIKKTKINQKIMKSEKFYFLHDRNLKLNLAKKMISRKHKLEF